MSHVRISHGARYPTGGNGGNGGSIFLQGCDSMNSLYQIGKAHLNGNPGKSGSGDKKNGKKGGDIIYRVPIGTMVYELEEPTKLLQAGKLKYFGLK